MSDMDAQPAELDPTIPPPDPARVALLHRLDWGPLNKQLDTEGPTAMRNATTNGRPLTDDEHALIGQCTYNDLAALEQLIHNEHLTAAERDVCFDQLQALLDHYQFGNTPDDTIDTCRNRMTTEDRAELDRIGNILAPDGNVWLTEDTTTNE